MYKLLLIRFKGQLWQINELPMSRACTAGGGEQLSPLEVGHQMGSPKPGATYCHVPVCVCEWRSPLKANHFGHVEICNFYYVVWSYCRFPYLECLQEREVLGHRSDLGTVLFFRKLCIFLKSECSDIIWFCTWFSQMLPYRCCFP